MVPRLLLLLLASSAVGLVFSPPESRSLSAPEVTTAAVAQAAPHHYPDFGYLPPRAYYRGRVFQLSQAYPKELPRKVPDICTGSFEDVKSGWMDYLFKVRAYCFKGNVGSPDVADDWQVHNNTENPWFHVPWQHFGPHGREGIHGLTKEAPVEPQQLAWTQTHSDGQTYAVGFYNAFGGVTIGQVWANPDHPGQVERKQGSGSKWGNMDIRFPVGTVVCKLLFVDLDPKDQVPFLEPPLKWQGYITKGYKSGDREIRWLKLIQMDVMVRHENAPHGWVFGTFQYNGAKTGKVGWDNLVPVGIQWGNDPDVTDDQSNPKPTRIIRNSKLKETRINEDNDELPPTHLGWNGRLNGPVDNPMSSCMSCHMTASTPQLRPISPLFQENPPTPGSKDWMEWFQNLKPGERFAPKSQPTDYSLQLSAGLQNFRTWRNEGSRLRYDDYKGSIAPGAAEDTRLRRDDRFWTETSRPDADGASEARVRRNFLRIQP